jgi:hypothetical protein
MSGEKTKGGCEKLTGRGMGEEKHLSYFKILTQYFLEGQM